MAEKRKLLAEIEKCFKKIDEGVEEFQDIMNKMQDANSDNQRDKYQDDLKKEIKKLQRLRDQLKGWQNNSDVKDKDRLLQYRKIIEQRMEQFKDIERENKTKPHSKQGLCAEEKLDPREKEKLDTVEWLQSQIAELEVDVDRTEVQLEALSISESGKKGRKAKDDAKKGGDKAKSEVLKKHLERLKFHIERLELCMRLVNNETLESKQVLDVLKDAMEMYVSSLDPDYDESLGPSDSLDPEDLYNELDLASYSTTLGGVVHVSSLDHEEKHENDSGKVHGHGSENGHAHEDEHIKSRHGSSDGQASPAPKRTIQLPQTTPIKQPTQPTITESPSVSAPTAAVLTPVTPPPPPQGLAYNSVAAAGLRNVQPSTVTTTPQTPASKPVTIKPAPTTPLPATPPPAAPLTNDENRSPSSTTTPVSTPIQQAPQPPPPQPQPQQQQAIGTPSKNEEPSHPAEAQQQASPAAPSTGASIEESSTGGSPAVSQTQHFLFSNGPSTQQADVLQQTSDVGTASAEIPATRTEPTETSPSSRLNTQDTASTDDFRQVLRLSQASNEPSNNKPQSAFIPPWLGASPLGRTPHSADHDVHLAALEQALQRCPPQMDSERPRLVALESYLPKMPCATAAYYPQSPPPNADTLEYYLRLSPETLFFMFYYMEGSRAQLLAAKALKKLSWRFHTKYLMWFQRHEEPKQITDDYEQGTYIYFDYEKWSQRKKEQFMFEYRYLEDKEFD